MRLINRVVFAIIVTGLALTGSCLWSVRSRNYELEAVVCQALGPGLVVLAIGMLAAVFAFAVGVMQQLQDDNFQLFKSFYAINLGLACLLPVGLVI